MAMFERIGSKISTASKDMAKKTKEIASITKINIQISGEEDNIKNRYEQIGKLYYDEYKDSPDEKLAEFCAAITESMNKIDLSKKQIQTIKGVKICSGCGAEMEDSSVFCSTCGFKSNVDEEVKAEKPEESKCPSCGEVVSDAQSFCPNCGGKQ